ncbi:putative heme-dependent peroxidase YwfI [Lentibacillus kapialis]|uniref:Coproheme decarboxylase n=1 Tax=Lentibacillus kapialis TaxID=340214 RepID=A0A917Q2V0_9BACI|nr:hydrogen peroxide-dependent heme synthase [Lentibacillus kapialis]GGK08424.1 putative heme-dependent peroxidase YwfI [Lentibacillus kapialis]
MIVEPVKTHEGWYVLHDFRTIDWEKWENASGDIKEKTLKQFQELLGSWQETTDANYGDYAMFSIIGQKADILFMFMRPTMKELNQEERAFSRSLLGQFTKPAYSFVSIVEKSSYTVDYDNPYDDPEMRKKLFPLIPKDAYICFYPMSKLRGEIYNWFQMPREDRKRLMYEHIETAKPYTETVRRIITGATGLDDYEWGVSLFCDDPLQFKKLIYGTRFDEVSARYGVFGSFLVGYRLEPADIYDYFM